MHFQEDEVVIVCYVGEFFILYENMFESLNIKMHLARMFVIKYLGHRLNV